MRKHSGAKPRRSSTQLESYALDAAINLSDAHARINNDKSMHSIFALAESHYRRALRSGQSDLELELAAAFELLFNVRLPRRPVLAYSVSVLTQAVSWLLRREVEEVYWPVPSFDNMRDVARHSGMKVTIVPESYVTDILLGTRPMPARAALWLTIPNNPTGFILSATEYAELAQLAYERRTLLVVDHCFRAFSPDLNRFDQYKILEESGCDYIVTEDTGKAFSTLDVKLGVLTASERIHESLRSLNQDILLNTSPYAICLITDVMRRFHRCGGLEELRQVIETNRALIRSAYAGTGLVNEMETTGVSVEWIRAPSGRLREKLLKQCEDRGLFMLRGDAFYGPGDQAGSKRLRIALARDVFVVEHAAGILRDVIVEITH